MSEEHTPANFDVGAPNVGGLAELGGDAEFLAKLSQPKMTGDQYNYLWTAINGGTQAARDSIAVSAEVALVIATLMLSFIMPQILVSPDDLGVTAGYADNEVMALRISRLILHFNVASLILSLVAFAYSWAIIFQCFACPNSKTFVKWLMASGPMLLPVLGGWIHICALLCFFVVLALTEVGQDPRVMVDVVVDAIILIVCATIFGFFQTTRFESKLQITKADRVAIQERGIEQLRRYHAECFGPGASRTS